MRETWLPGAAQDKKQRSRTRLFIYSLRCILPSDGDDVGDGKQRFFRVCVCVSVCASVFVLLFLLGCLVVTDRSDDIGDGNGVYLFFFIAVCL